jgi:hypothetical protein
MTRGRIPEDRWVWAFGERKRLHEWVADERCSIDYAALYHRIYRAHWEPEHAISTPRWGVGPPQMVTGVAE